MRLIVTVLVLLAPRVFAQTFSDDFESGSSNWVETHPAPGTLSADDNAARTGIWGIRMNDPSPGVGVGQGNFFSHAITNVGSGDFRYSFWMRITAVTSNSGYITPVMIEGTGPLSSLMEVQITFPARTVDICARGADDVSVCSGVSFTPDSAWHLYTLDALGMGTVDGTYQLAVDGALGAADTISWDGMAITRIVLGQPYGQREWAGTLDFDDVEASESSSPLPLPPGPAPSSPGGSGPGTGSGTGTGADTARAFEVGCACVATPGSAGGTASLLALTLILLRARRPRRP